MPASTSRTGLPYPLGTDPVSDGDDAIKNLAERLDGTAGNAVSVPFAMAAGVATVPAPAAVPNGNTVTVTFPASRFTQTPLIYVTTEDTLTTPSFPFVASVTAASAILFRWQLQGAPVARPLRWLAVQMTSAASPG